MNSIFGPDFADLDLSSLLDLGVLVLGETGRISTFFAALVELGDEDLDRLDILFFSDSIESQSFSKRGILLIS
jgi:hypothetical protein